MENMDNLTNIIDQQLTHVETVIDKMQADTMSLKESAEELLNEIKEKNKEIAKNGI